MARDQQSEDVRLVALGTDYRGQRLKLSLDAGYQEYRTDGTSFLLYIYEDTAVPRAPETNHDVSPAWAASSSRDKYVAMRADYDVATDTSVYTAVGARDHKSSIVNPYSEILNGDGTLAVSPYEEAYFAKTHWSFETGIRSSFTTGSVTHAATRSATAPRGEGPWREHL